MCDGGGGIRWRQASAVTGFGGGGFGGMGGNIGGMGGGGGSLSGGSFDYSNTSKITLKPLLTAIANTLNALARRKRRGKRNIRKSTAEAGMTG